MRETLLRASPSEKQFAAMFEGLLRLRNWTYYHTFNSRHSAPGFPDYVCVRHRVVYVELKAERGKVSDAQSKWLLRLKNAGAEAWVFRPSQWAEIERVLS